ncbi:MAG: iron export ABC transporter permease subunit FetB [Verrucomicrobiota bacterium]
MNEVIQLSAFDLALASCGVLLLAGISIWMQLRITRLVLIAGLRTMVQLFLIGLVLKWLFDNITLTGFSVVSLIMLLAAGREATRRQQRRFSGIWGFGIGTTCMLLSSFTVTLFALLAIVDVEPWYQPRYAIPLLGMLLGNTMNGISLGVDRLTQRVWKERTVIEARLILGQTAGEAMLPIRRDCIRTGLIPIVNAMTIAGIASLPGMMTGQILAGSPPIEAAKYQILIMFLIAAGTGFGTVAAVWIGSRRLFDERHRLRLDRLKS